MRALTYRDSRHVSSAFSVYAKANPTIQGNATPEAIAEVEVRGVLLV